MLVDIHTNLMWYPDHMSDEFVEFAYAAKKAKMRLSEDVYYAGHEDQYKNAFDSTPETLLKATEDCDRVVVFGLKAPYCGMDVPQELVAGFVAKTRTGSSAGALSTRTTKTPSNSSNTT